MASAANVFPSDEETLPRSLFGRPTRRAYRAAVADIVRTVKASERLTNEGLADRIGCHEDTVKNAENEVGSLDPVTLFGIAYEFGEEAIQPVRDLYLCAPAEPLTPKGLLGKAIGVLSRLEKELEG